MATFSALTDIVATIIQDESLEILIPTFLNQGVLEIAGGMDSAFGDFTTPPLPKLLTIDTVDTVTDVAYVEMPATFQRDLVFAANEDGTEIDIGNSWIEFMESNPLLSRSGDIYEVIEQGGKLYYQGIPITSEAVTIHFYRLPVDMVLATDVPDGIPLKLQIPLLVNYACKELFNLIEDGIESAQVNTAKHAQLFLAALRVLELSIPADTRSLRLGD